MKTLTCDNPNCQTVFSPPVGKDYAACPACHTWHFVQNSEAKDEAQAPPTIPGTLNYTPTLASAKPIEQEDNSPPSYPLDTPPAMPAHEAHEGNDQIEEVQPLPHLTSADGQRFELKPGINTIGRGECDIRLSDKSVSRLHCVIDVQPRPNGNGWDYIVYDIGHIESSASANGVFLSNRTPRLENYERVPFRKGLILEVGRVKLTLES